MKKLLQWLHLTAIIGMIVCACLILSVVFGLFSWSMFIGDYAVNAMPYAEIISISAIGLAAWCVVWIVAELRMRVLPK